MRLKWSVLAESCEKGVNPPRESLLRSTPNSLAEAASWGRRCSIGLGELVGSSPRSIESISGGLEPGGAWRGSDDRSIAQEATRPRIDYEA